MKRIILPLLALTIASSVFAQTDNSILLTVGNEKITKTEFINAYLKNNSLSTSTEKDLREYLDLYTNFRMKVQEAIALKMDTAKAFQKELASYKNQSAQQYLTDSEVTEQLLEEAYTNAHHMLRGSHILIRCLETASPKDTLAAYNKAMQIRNKIINGLDFNKAAALYSEDESARNFINPQTQRLQHGNNGELGYFGILDMIYPFEKAAYSTPVGQVSMPIRTQFGYHLIYIQDKYPYITKVYVSQIFFKDTAALDHEPSADLKAKMDDLKRKYKAGISFAELAKSYSEDLATKDSGGVMLPFVPNRRPGNYVYAALHLKDGEISEPVPSAIGWHILKLDSVQHGIFNDETKYSLKNRLQHDARARKGKESLVEKLKVEYNFKEDGKAAAMKFFKKNLPESYFQSTTIAIDSLKGIEKLKPMCTFADQSVTAIDFSQYISRFQGMHLKSSVVDFLESIYPKFVTETIIRYESEHLIDKYPEHKALVNEFHDGMLLYEINSEKVWNAAIKDSVGLENFYESIKTEYPVDTPNDTLKYKPLSEIRAIVVSRYQDYLEAQWLKELHAKYPVFVDEKVFKSLLTK